MVSMCGVYLEVMMVGAPGAGKLLFYQGGLITMYIGEGEHN